MLDHVKITVEFENNDEEDGKENSDPLKKKKFEKKEMADRSLLRNALYAFIGNLCLDKSLRLCLAGDQEGILSQIITDFKQDLKE